VGKILLSFVNFSNNLKFFYPISLNWCIGQSGHESEFKDNWTEQVNTKTNGKKNGQKDKWTQ
jgi:hypothetical protein